MLLAVVEIRFTADERRLLYCEAVLDTEPEVAVLVAVGRKRCRAQAFKEKFLLLRHLHPASGGGEVGSEIVLCVLVL